MKSYKFAAAGMAALGLALCAAPVQAQKAPNVASTPGGPGGVAAAAAAAAVSTPTKQTIFVIQVIPTSKSAPRSATPVIALNPTGGQYYGPVQLCAEYNNSNDTTSATALVEQALSQNLQQIFNQNGLPSYKPTSTIPTKNAGLSAMCVELLSQ